MLGNGKINGQQALSKANICQPATEEILSLIKSTYNLPPNRKGVLVAGEVRATNQLQLTEKPITLTQALAMSGGILQTAKSRIFLIRQSTADAAKVKIEISLNDFRNGLDEDIQLKEGDVLFVPRGGVAGKLIPPPSNPANSSLIKLTDSPINSKYRLF